MIGYQLTYDQQQAAVKLLIKLYKAALRHPNILDNDAEELIEFLTILGVDLKEVYTNGSESI